MVDIAGENNRKVIYVTRKDQMDQLREAADKAPQKGLQKSLQNVMKQAQNAGNEKKK